MPYAIYDEVDNAIRKVKRYRTKTQRRRKVARTTSLRSGERLAQHLKNKLRSIVILPKVNFASKFSMALEKR
jgi:hypothetical protein